MISISGHAGTGKTTAGAILTQEGFWVFDVGSFWRTFRDSVAPGMNVGELNFAMKEYTEDEHWEDKFLAAVIRNKYDREMRNKKDLVMVGYRSLVGLNDVFGRLEGKVFPDRQRSYLHFVCTFELAMERIIKRDGAEWRTTDIELRYATEKARGLDDFLNIANNIIHNDRGIDFLKDNILKVMYEDLAYPREVVEIQKSPEGHNRRTIDFFTHNMDVREGDISRLMDRERK